MRFHTDVEADVFPAAAGWLAVSKPGSAVRIGVIGHTEQEARERFRSELKAWRRLRKKRLAIERIAGGD